ncbi:FadD3 family acyl-CoA ligase [Nocardia seriolae]|uniref:Fatty acid--CoA ligase n=1 Tax=Nocardia seriolae TaxID=37332 RepID=A0A0B8N9F3_9NOCA|nr:FadD3 family acyl-CoA ligase [Nocardia seriolae]APA95349.1 Long-chain-fatty-acid--CoA ligase [Nocardia seriolae]MTJ66506.1 AMP-binding protein [Nocardia seriolae]MTJ70599.1 AMP-binding protein [Nocardia seriolae]MTJ85597.1 AMP-binding protein [Nocardia seriolae]MTK29594.1 AMP-binding protein [Nocardia seriolae]
MTSPPQTTPLALHEAAHRYGDAPAVGDGAVRLSWSQLLDSVRETARALIARGIQRGDRIGIWAPNTHHWVTAVLATHYVGAAIVPLNTRYVADEAADVLGRVDAKALFIAGTFLGRDRLTELRTAAPELGIETVIVIPSEKEEPVQDAIVWSELGKLAEAVSLEDAIARAESVSADDLSDILFTSGTTGRSKGTLIAHRQALAGARAWSECATLHSADRYLVVPPFFHNFGYKAGIIACLVTGASIIPQATFDVPETMRLVHDEGITVLTGPPTIYQTILEHPARHDADLSSLRVAVTGAATVPVVLIERMRSELQFDVVLTAYGLSESGGFGTMCRPEDSAETIANTCGRAIGDFETKLADNGELLLRGSQVMLGYLDDPQATADTIDTDGWLHTGDVATIDERGYVKITDRLKDMYISGGFNVYPAEVEQALARLEGVAETAVIGIEDERMGEVGKAFVVRTPGAELTVEDVVAHAKTLLANFKVPRFVEFRDQLPYSAAGKVLKRELREEKA